MLKNWLKKPVYLVKIFKTQKITKVSKGMAPVVTKLTKFLLPPNFSPSKGGTHSLTHKSSTPLYCRTTGPGLPGYVQIGRLSFRFIECFLRAHTSRVSNGKEITTLSTDKYTK